MSALLYTVTAVVAPGRAVPRPKDHDDTRDRYESLAREACESRPMFIAFTEAWFGECRDGISEGLDDGYLLLAPLGNSAVLAYDSTQVYLARSYRGVKLRGTAWLHGLVAGRWGIASDPRRMPWGLFVVRRTGDRRVRVGAFHCTPRRRELGDSAARATEKAQGRARSRANALLAGAYPGLVLGDFNNTRPGIGTRSVGAPGDEIIRVANRDGLSARFGKSTVEGYAQPGFDHQGLRVSVPVWSS